MAHPAGSGPFYGRKNVPPILDLEAEGTKGLQNARQTNRRRTKPTAETLPAQIEGCADKRDHPSIIA